jgi:hypothetical protein
LYHSGANGGSRTGLAIDHGLWETVAMPRDRKETYSDRQSQAARAKKEQAVKKVVPKEDAAQPGAPIVKVSPKKR